MSVLSLLQPEVFTIWLIGLCLLVSMIVCYSRIKRGSDSNALKLLCFGFLILSLFVLVKVPSTEINKAISYANEISGPDEQVTSYEDISYTAKDAYRLTSLTGEQREEFMLFYGVEAQGAVVIDGKEIILNPQRGTAWIILTTFTILSLLIYFQAPVRFLPFNSKK